MSVSELWRYARANFGGAEEVCHRNSDTAVETYAKTMRERPSIPCKAKLMISDLNDKRFGLCSCSSAYSKWGISIRLMGQ